MRTDATSVTTPRGKVKVTTLCDFGLSNHFPQKAGIFVQFAKNWCPSVPFCSGKPLPNLIAFTLRTAGVQM